MYLSTLITDNVSELLVKILEFTRARHEVLVENIDDMYNPDFLPKDLDVEQFAELMDEAIDEHQLCGRLRLRDTRYIKFGENGRFEVHVVVDEDAKELLEQNVKDYVKLQKNKLKENLVNYRLAREILKQKQGITSVFSGY
jgi:flagellar basal body rod protein FlgB